MNQLLSRVINGDKSAEQLLFQMLHVRFRVIAKRRTRGQVGDDIAQDACLTVLEKLRSGVRPDNFEAWAYNVLRNKIGNYYQYRDTRRPVAPSRPLRPGTADAGLAEDELHTRHTLLECMHKLIRAFPRHARVLNLIYQGYDTEEICGRLEIKPSYLYVILNRGRRMLRECIESGRLRDER